VYFKVVSDNFQVFNILLLDVKVPRDNIEQMRSPYVSRDNYVTQMLVCSKFIFTGYRNFPGDLNSFPALLFSDQDPGGNSVKSHAHNSPPILAPLRLRSPVIGAFLVVY
jgi:hypothetical protein